MLKTRVKVGKVTNLSDARYCAGMGVDMLGFSIGGTNSMDTKKYKEITDWVSGPDIVVEWAGSDLPDNLADILRPYNANWVEINAQLLKNIPDVGTRLMIRLHVDQWKTSDEWLRVSKDKIGYIVLEGNGSPDYGLVTAISRVFPVLLGYGISLDNLDSLLGLPIAGISLAGTAETSPGLKDYSQLSGILERLEVE